MNMYKDLNNTDSEPESERSPEFSKECSGWEVRDVWLGGADFRINVDGQIRKFRVNTIFIQRIQESSCYLQDESI